MQKSIESLDELIRRHKRLDPATSVNPTIKYSQKKSVLFFFAWVSEPKQLYAKHYQIEFIIFDAYTVAKNWL